MLANGIYHVPQLQHQSSTENHRSAGYLCWPTRTQTNSEIHCKYVKHRCNGCVVSCGGQKKKFMLPVQDVALKGHQQAQKST